MVNSIQTAIKPGKLNIYFSLDGGASSEVKEYVSSLVWELGSKKLIQHELNLGVDQHTLKVLKMMDEIGDALIIEDDVRLSPYAFNYIASCVDVLDQEQVKGLSLYRYTFKEEDHFPFELLPNDEFLYYQQRSSSNSCFYKAKDIREYLQFVAEEDIDYTDFSLPKNVMSWSSEIWEKSFYCYLIYTNGFLAFPRYSLATDYGEFGVHMKKEINRYIHHSPLYLSDDFNSKPLEATKNCYDAFYEILPSKLKDVLDPEFIDVTIDIYGAKDLEKIHTKYVLSSKPSTKPIKSWGRVLKPELSNLLFNEAGSHFSLGEKESFSPLYKHSRLKENFFYYYPDSRITDLIKMKWAEIWSRF